mgnify:CR=1 FL=1
MAIQEYVGAVVLEVDGKEIECVSVSNDSNTGYMPVKTMRRKRTISGYCMGFPSPCPSPWTAIRWTGGRSSMPS